MRTPNASSSRAQESREFIGLVAGRGKSLVGIGVIIGVPAPKLSTDLSMSVLANPNHVVAPEQAR